MPQLLPTTDVASRFASFFLVLFVGLLLSGDVLAQNPKPNGKPGGEKKDDKKEAKKPPVESIKRPEKPADAPDSEELQVRPGDDGKVKFNFRGQKWPDVLEWLAEISGTSMDWQELPGDFLNLSTQRAYGVDEIRDMLNERLMTRGYTILAQQEGFVVEKLEGLNMARVPRVHPEDLRFRDDHEFVKVSFPLSWLMAEDAVEELKPMLGEHGTMSALTSSNRLEVMDVVTNLREVHHVLQEEQSAESRAARVHEFFLKYTRADDVVTQLKALLGKEQSGGSPSGAMDPNMMRQMQQMMQQMQRSAQQNKGSSGGTRGSSSDDVHLVINSRRNSIIVNAPADKLVILAEAVKMFDVPPNPGSTIGGNFQRVKVFRLAQLDPEALITMMEQAGNLDPSTQLVPDKKNRAVIAYATPADEITIQALISKLDGSGRKFKVIRLRKLQADYVAGSIRFMMGKDEEKDDSSSRRSSYYSYYGYGRGGSNDDDKNEDDFRVDADVINNRLLLWANEVELKSIEDLLIQLGELPAPGGNSNGGKMRTIQLGDEKESRAILERLKRIWPEVSPAPLQIEVPPPKKEVEPEKSELNPEYEKLIDSGKTVESTNKIHVPVHLVAMQSEDNATEEATAPPVASEEDPLEKLSQQQLLERYFPKPEEPPEEASKSSNSKEPVVIRMDEYGRLIIASDNPQLLDLLEDVLTEMTPPSKAWKVYQLKYASAVWVSLNLEDFFGEEEEDDTSRGSPFFYYGYRDREEKQSDPLRLSQRKPVKFLSDSDTNTIIVQNATAEQLATIEELIELYDKPEPVTTQSARMNSSYSVKYSKASAIAETIKEVFRDLLSSNDKSLQNGNNKQEGSRASSERTYIYQFGDEDDEPTMDGTRGLFKGKLSFGVDDLSNTLLISCEGENLMNLVMDMVKKVDEAAKPISTVRVVNLKSGMDGARVKEMLDSIVTEGNRKLESQAKSNNNRQNGQNGGQPNRNGKPGNNNNIQQTN